MSTLSYKLSNSEAYTFAYIETEDDVSKERWNSDASIGVVNDFPSESDIPTDLNEDSPFYIRYKDTNNKYVYAKLTIIAAPSNTTFEVEVSIDGNNNNNSFLIEYQEVSNDKWYSIRRERNKIFVQFNNNYKLERRDFYLFIQSNLSAKEYIRIYFEQDIYDYQLSIKGFKHYIYDTEINIPEDKLITSNEASVYIDNLTQKTEPNKESISFEIEDTTNISEFVIGSIEEYRKVGSNISSNYIEKDGIPYVMQTRIQGNMEVTYYQEGIWFPFDTNNGKDIYVPIDYDNGLKLKKQNKKDLIIISNGICSLYEKVLYKITLYHKIDKAQKAFIYVDVENYISKDIIAKANS